MKSFWLVIPQSLVSASLAWSYKVIVFGERYVRKMFIQQMQSIGVLPSTPYNSRPYRSPEIQSVDFQYQLCQLFMTKTGQQLHQKEAGYLQSHSALLHQIQKQETDKTRCTSTDSGTQSVPSSVNQEDPLQQVQSPKRGEAAAARKLENRLASWISQVEEKCSVLCLINIKTIISQYKKLLDKWCDVEARESVLSRKHAFYLRGHEQNVMLKNKLEAQSRKVEDLRLEIDCLKEKNQTIIDYANGRLKQLASHQNMVETNQKVYRDVRHYLADKEKSINRRTANLEALESQIMAKLSESLPSESCEPCCTMLRRLKDSLMKFKCYLQGEGLELQNLFGRYKKTLFSHKSASRLP